MTLPELERTINRALDRLGVDKDAELARETMKGILEAVSVLNGLSIGVDGARMAIGIINRELERQDVDAYTEEDGTVCFDWIEEDEK